MVDEETSKILQRKTGYPTIDKKHLEGTTYLERHPLIPSVNIANTMKMLWLNTPDEPAVSHDELKATHKELLNDAKTISKAFKEIGIKKGDIIAVSMPNYYQAVASFIAANRLGAIVTFLNPYSRDDELIQQLNKYESPLLINFDKDSEYNENIKKQTKVKNVITLEKGKEKIRDFNVETDRLIGYDDLINFSDLQLIGDYYKGLASNHVKGKDDALILFTSGSTGNPKDMLFTNRNVLAACMYYKNSAHLEKFAEKNGKWMGVVPFMYPYGFAASVLSTLLAGREAMLAPNAGPDNINEYLKQNPNLIFGSPAFLELVKRNVDPNLDMSSLGMFISGGDFLSEQQSRDAIKFFKDHNADVKMCNGSGNGELLGCCTNSMNVEYRPDTVGKLVNGPKFVVIDEETGKEVKYNEDGILCVKGANVFKEYYKNKELTDEAMIEFNGEKYYKTGNYGHLSEDGYFTLVGRSSRFFIINTLNKVYCELIQNVVSQIAVVDSVAVVPKPNDEQLFESKAYVVLKPGVPDTPEIREYIMQKSFDPYIDYNGNSVSLKEYEVPKSVTILDKLPRTPGADKIDYEYLKKEAEKEYNLEKENNKQMKLKK